MRRGQTRVAGFLLKQCEHEDSKSISEGLKNCPSRILYPAPYALKTKTKSRNISRNTKTKSSSAVDLHKANVQSFTRWSLNAPRGGKHGSNQSVSTDCFLTGLHKVSRDPAPNGGKGSVRCPLSSYQAAPKLAAASHRTHDISVKSTVPTALRPRRRSEVC